MPEEKVQKYFTIRIEGTAPTISEYKVLAGSPEEALTLIEKGSAQPRTVKTAHAKTKKQNAKVYQPGSSNLVILTKKY